jgi:hypothetical protein
MRVEPGPAPARGMSVRVEDMPKFEIPEDDGLPGFSPEDLRLSPEDLYRKLQRKRGYK